ncbi:MAG: PRC-barrel domain-containing protein [Chloroflexi bacterium]|nr:PRC-barrel domain-containing protein [Chloroflexota bacterium]
MHHEEERHSDETREQGRIAFLDDLDDFEVHEDDPDVRGWVVLSEDGEKIGEVEDLLIDVPARKVRYLDVDVEDELLGGENGGDRDVRMLVPIGLATVDDEEDRIVVRGIRTTDLSGAPLHRRGALTRDDESAIRGFIDPEYGSAPGGTGDFYEHPHYDEGSLYRSRR